MYQRKLTFEQAVTKCLKENYCNFSGRSSRSEYWWFCLFTVLVGAVCGFFSVFSSTLGNTLQIIANLALLLPSLGVAVRRLHDINKSGWWLLLALIPLVGAIILIVWYCKESDNQPNQYGMAPNLEA